MERVNIGIINLIVSNQLKEAYFKGMLLTETKERISEVSNVIKNSTILQLENKVFNNIDKKFIDNDMLASRYIDKNIKLFEVFTLNEVKTEHDKLNKFITDKDIPTLNEKKIKLFNSISILVEEMLSNNQDVNVDNIHEAFTYVLDYVKEPKYTETYNDIEHVNEQVIEIAIDKFNERYNQMNEGDSDLFKKLISSTSEEKQQIFETYKKENLEHLKKLNEENNSDKLETTISKINEMVCDDDDSTNANIINLHELNKGLI
jgi:hypothetical protein